MPWYKTDFVFSLLAWSSWIYVFFVDIVFPNPENSLVGLATMFYPIYLAFLFLIPGGWYLYEKIKPDWKYKDYYIYFVCSVLVLSSSIYFVNNFESQFLGIIGRTVIYILWVPALIGIIPTNYSCFKRFKKSITTK